MISVRLFQIIHTLTDHLSDKAESTYAFKILSLIKSNDFWNLKKEVFLGGKDNNESISICTKMNTYFSKPVYHMNNIQQWALM